MTPKKGQVRHKRLAITLVNRTNSSHLNLVQLVVPYQIKQSMLHLASDMHGCTPLCITNIAALILIRQGSGGAGLRL